MTKAKLGTGVSFKMQHLADIQKDEFRMDWFELLTEEFLVPSKRVSFALEVLKERCPLVLHGVGLSIGSPLPLDFDYLSKVKRLADELDPPWVSDHLSWGQVPGAHFHELLPLPLKKEVADYVVERAKIVQDYLERPFALENVTSYLRAEDEEMEEWEFCSYVVEKSKTHMLLDVNNIYVTARNHRFNPRDYFKRLPWDRIVEIHLAGHLESDGWFLDSHNRPLISEVWDLYKEAWGLAGQPATLVEYDGISQSYSDICVEVAKARELQEEVLHANAALTI